MSRAPLSWMGWLPIVFIVSAVSPSFAGVSKLHPPFRDQTGTLRMAQVLAIATREEIKGAGVHYQHLLNSGITDSLLRDSSVAIGRTNCCGGKNEEGTAMWFYVPPDLHLRVGDIVEVRMGRQPDKKDLGEVNAASRVREHQDATSPACRWDPPNERLWTRILQCDWMESEGWTKTKGFNATWLKRAEDVEGK